MTSLVVFSGLYTWRNNKSINTTNLITRAEPFKSIVENKDTNQTWNFIDEKDRNIPLLAGKWEWSDKTKFMVPPINEHAIFSLPIAPQEKCFVIESLVVSLATIKRPNLNLNLLAYWANDLQVLAHESTSMSKKYKLEGDKPAIFKSYFYKNYICTFANNQFVGARKYSENLTGSKVTILDRNYAIQKISSHTLEAPPTELLKAIEEFSSQKWDVQSSWQVDRVELRFNDPQ